MKNIFAALLCLSALIACQPEKKEPVDYVNPYIGNISHLLVPTFATIQLPNSLLRVYPARHDYTSEEVNGLPVIVTNHRERSAFSISPTQDGEGLKPVTTYNWDQEKITPYSFDIQLADNSIRAQYAVSHQSAIYELSFVDITKPAFITFNSKLGKMAVKENMVSGYQSLDDVTKVYLAIETEEKPEMAGILSEGRIAEGTTVEGKDAAVTMRFAAGTKKVMLRYGVSMISEDQALRNLRREQGEHFDRETVAQVGRETWNETLARIEVKGGSEDEKTVLYTSFYRTFERPICLSEDGRYWSGYDGKVHEDGGKPFYADDWIWDTYRAAHPLRCLIEPEKEENIIESYLRMAEQNDSKWLPTFPEITGDTRRMNCNHGVAMVADALWKGLKVDAERGFDYGRRAMEEKTLAPWSSEKAGYIDNFYKQHGYIPALNKGEKETDPNVHSFERRQSVAVTLGTAYDEWCLSRIAEFLGDKENQAKYMALSYNYRNLYNPETSFFHPKDKNGEFISDFDYRFSGGIGARDYYAENNGWTYRWDVQHNFADLINLMGSREQLIKNLDQTFREPMGKSKFSFYAQLPDQTGNIGQFTMANEPSLHIPYIYNYAGAPWKTQKRIRQCLKTWFRNDLMGVPGDEDGGGLTSFVVFSSLGFYPVTPGLPIYNIGSPLFSDVRIKLSNGNDFHIAAPNCSDENKYIQSATLNGQPWNKPWISHKDIMNGATLILKMGSHPNKNWGSEADVWDMEN